MRRRCLLALAWLACAGTLTAAPVSATLVEQPRSFGYTLGDILTQRIGLNAGVKLESLQLPPADRIGQWLERRPPRLSRDPQGRRWLLLEYQIINAPLELATATLPALSIASKTPGPALVIPAWPISIGPLTPPEAFGVGALQVLQPDESAAAYATAPLVRRISVGLGTLALTGLAWLLWLYWRNQRELHSLPFSRAAQQLRELQAAGAGNSAAAWISLHRAFNAAAGRVIHAESLDELFLRVPASAALQGQIEEFYRRSNERFFATAPAEGAFPLTDLCHALRRIERSTVATHAA